MQERENSESSPLRQPSKRKGSYDARPSYDKLLTGLSERLTSNDAFQGRKPFRLLNSGEIAALFADAPEEDVEMLGPGISPTEDSAVGSRS